MPGRKRLFIAVPLDPELRDKIARYAEKLLVGAPAFVAVPPANYHLTIQFLGSAAEEKTPAIVSRLESVARRHEAFEMPVRGAGSFPRVLWVDIPDGSGKLADLARDLASELKLEGFEPERRPFTAHLTIARSKENRAKAPNSMRNGEPEFGLLRVNEIVLYESFTLPDGARYQELFRCPLASEPSITITN